MIIEGERAMTTVTTIELAKGVGLTPKSIRLAIHRGDLRATRISKGQGRSASATEFVIQRSEADDWKARRAARKVGKRNPAIEEAQEQRCRSKHYAFFASRDSTDDDTDTVEQLKRAALSGVAQAQARLRLPWEQGGVALSRWWRRGVGEIV
jgi:hypothetical protein